MAKKDKEPIVNDTTRRRADFRAALNSGVSLYSDGPANAPGVTDEKTLMKRWNTANKAYKANQDAQNRAETSFRKSDESAARRNKDKVSGGWRTNYNGGTWKQSPAYRRVLREEAMPAAAKRDAIAAMRNKLKNK